MKAPEAVLCFTLMDYDVITKNDFGGEAFLSLTTVAGGGFTHPGLTPHVGR